MERDQVINLASEYARREGYRVENYEISTNHNKNEWRVFFKSHAAKPSPGDFFTVHVNAASKSAERLVPGK
jgi:hypothetical protein